MAKKKFDLVETGIKAAALGAGAIGGNALVNVVPVVKDQSPLIKGGAKVALGLIAPMFVKNELVEYAGYGMMAVGAKDVVAHFMPTLAGIPFAEPQPILIETNAPGMNGIEQVEVAGIDETQVSGLPEAQM